jgi:signal transduction histidine kinase
MNMFRSLLFKLTAAFVLVALVSAAIAMVFIRSTNVNRFVDFVLDQTLSNMNDELTEYYSETGSWDGVEAYWGEIIRTAADEQMPQAIQVRPTPDEDQLPPSMGPGERGAGDAAFIYQRRSLIGLANDAGEVIMAANPSYPAGKVLTASELKEGTPVEVDGERVGTLLIARRDPILTPEERMFIERTNQALLLASFGSATLAVIVGVFLAQALIRPLRALTQATQRIAAGDLEQQVEIKSGDEIGTLAVSFNRMSQEVARVNRLRRQMTADIAHDLRTPLTVISGYVESIREGVLQPTPERMDLIYTEIGRLERLIEDLRLLSQADAGQVQVNPQRLAPGYVLERAVASHRHRADQKQVDLVVDISGALPEINVDEARMMQIFDNLISNALRYTGAGGRITLSAADYDQHARLSVQDTGEGIPEEQLQHIFERLYRVDPSRAALEGESGLGLAIVRALVETQGGTVWAESTLAEGTVIHMEFPSAG